MSKPCPDADHAMGELLEALIKNRHLDITHAHITRLHNGTGWVWDACWYLRTGNTATLQYQRSQGKQTSMVELVKVALKAKTVGEHEAQQHKALDERRST